MKHLTPMTGASQTNASADGTAFQTDVARAVLRRHRLLIVLVTLAATVLVTVWTLRLPKVYQAIATLEYDPNPATPLGSTVEDTSAPVNQFLMSREFFETQNLIIQSRAVAERVVDRLGLASDPDFATSEQPMNEAIAERLQGMLEVDPVKNTRLVKLKVRDTEPERAATLVNAIAEAYIEKTMEDRLGSTVDASQWLAKQLDSTRTQLNESEHALHEFKQKHNVLSVSLEDRQNLLAEEMRTYNQRLTDAKARRIELQARLQRLKAIRKSPEAIQDAKNKADIALNELRTSLRSKLGERASLSVRYGDAHPTIQELDKQTDAIRREIDKEVAAMIKAAKGDLDEVRSVENGLSRALKTSQKAGLDLNLREIEYSKLYRQRESNSKLYNLLLQRTAETDLTGMLRTTHVRVVDKALTPKYPVSPRVLLNVLAGLLGGFLLGLVLALGLARIDRRIRSMSDVEQFGLTVLGIFPRIGASEPDKSKAAEIAPEDMERVVHTHPRSIAAESCRTVRTNLMFMSAEHPLKSLVITSANPRDGKTTVASNIAIAFAQSGQRVLLIDADLRRPRLHKAFEITNERGLTTALIGEQSLSDVTRSTEVEGLSIITSGPVPPNPSELLHTQRFGKLLEEAKSRYDRVIFDSPPLRAVTDAAILAPQCAGALLIVRANNTTRDALASALRSLTDVQANVVGSVLNDVDPRGDSSGYGYGGYYHYYRDDDRSEGSDPNISAA